VLIDRVGGHDHQDVLIRLRFNDDFPLSPRTGPVLHLHTPVRAVNLARPHRPCHRRRQGQTAHLVMESDAVPPVPLPVLSIDPLASLAQLQEQIHESLERSYTAQGNFGASSATGTLVVNKASTASPSGQNGL
jgi:hypothetical protein